MADQLIVRTQEELNEVPADFEGYVEVAFGDEEKPAIIDRPSDIAVFIIRGETGAVAYGNSYVHAYGKSHVEAREESHVEACDQSRVVANGESRVIVFDETVQAIQFGSSNIEYVR